MMDMSGVMTFFFFFQAEDGIRDVAVTGVQTCALPISHHARLDEHDVAADRRVIHRGGDPDLVLAGHALGMDLGPPEEVVHVPGVHREALDLRARDLARDLASQLADLALELADAGLARVTRDDSAQRGVGDRELLGGEPVFRELPRNEIPLRDLELLPLGVAREGYSLQAIEQRP